MATIWLDVTTLLQWQRSAVGIVRCEMECAQFALNGSIGQNVKYCVFNKENASYHEVPASNVTSAIGRVRRWKPEHISTQVSQTQPNHFGAEQILAQNKFDYFVIKGVRSLPFGVAKHLESLLQRNRQKVYDLTRWVHNFLNREGRSASKSAQVRALTNNGNSGLSEPGEASFEAGDIHISLGLDWDKKDLAYLYKIKTALDFSVVLFAYDLIPVKFPQLCVHDVASSFTRYFADLAWTADKVLCISRTTQEDFLQLLEEIGAPAPENSVITLGSEVTRPKKENINPGINIEGPYILFVSTIERRKNHETIYRAYTRLIAKGEKNLPQLVLVGMQGWGVDGLLSDIHLDPLVKGCITMLNDTSDVELDYLYRNCLFTVYPSLYEGWGLPVAESLSYGKFCLASNTSSVPEVGGEFLEYLDPWQVKDWEDAILKYTRSSKLLSDREEEIKANYKPVSWETSAKNIFDAALGSSTVPDQV